MKYNIKKLQSGGMVVASDYTTPFIPPSSGTKSSSKGSSGGESEELLNSIYKQLVGEGLTNDVYTLMDSLSDVKELDNPFLVSENRSSFLKKFGKINEVIRNKKDWEKAFTIAETSGGIGEIAVGSMGELYTKNDKGELGIISMDQYSKNRDKFRPLTVSEVLMEREKNPNLAFNTSVFTVAQNSKGIDKIMDNIRDVISSLGTEEETKESFMSLAQSKAKYEQLSNLKKPTAQQQAELTELEAILNSPTDLKLKITTASERGHLDKALSYIWGSLDRNDQNKLRAVGISNGIDDPRDFIKNMLISETTAKVSTEYSQVSGGAGSKTAKEQALTPWELFHKDKLMNPNLTFAWNDPKYHSMFIGVMGAQAPLILPNGKNIGPNTLSTILSTPIGQLVQGNTVYFGNKKVNPVDYKNLVYDGNDVAKVYMPVNSDGSPDYEANKKFKDVYKLYEANKNGSLKSTQAAHDFFRKHGYNVFFEEKVNENGQIEKVVKSGSDVKPFLLLYGYTNDDAENLTAGNTLLSEQKGTNRQGVMQLVNSVWTKKIGKNTVFDGPEPLTFNKTDYYAGVIAVPYRMESAAVASALVGHGPTELPVNIGVVQANIANPGITNGFANVLNND